MGTKEMSSDKPQGSRIPTVPELAVTIERVLQGLEGGGSLDQIRDCVIRDLKLPPEVTAIRHKEQQPRSELDYRMAWARTKLRQQGRIERIGRGVWRLTVGTR